MCSVPATPPPDLPIGTPFDSSRAPENVNELAHVPVGSFTTNHIQLHDNELVDSQFGPTPPIGSLLHAGDHLGQHPSHELPSISEPVQISSSQVRSSKNGDVLADAPRDSVIGDRHADAAEPSHDHFVMQRANPSTPAAPENATHPIYRIANAGRSQCFPATTSHGPSQVHSAPLTQYPYVPLSSQEPLVVSGRIPSTRCLSRAGIDALGAEKDVDATRTDAVLDGEAGTDDNGVQFYFSKTALERMGTVQNVNTTRVTGTAIRMFSRFVVERVNEAGIESHLKTWEQFVKLVPAAGEWTGKSKKMRQGPNASLDDVQAVGVMHATLFTWKESILPPKTTEWPQSVLLATEIRRSLRSLGFQWLVSTENLVFSVQTAL